MPPLEVVLSSVLSMFSFAYSWSMLYTRLTFRTPTSLSRRGQRRHTCSVLTPGMAVMLCSWRMHTPVGWRLFHSRDCRIAQASTCLGRKNVRRDSSLGISAAGIGTLLAAEAYMTARATTGSRRSDSPDSMRDDVSVRYGFLGIREGGGAWVSPMRIVNFTASS